MSDKECFNAQLAVIHELVSEIIQDYPQVSWASTPEGNPSTSVFSLDADNSAQSLLADTQLLQADVANLRKLGVKNSEALDQLDKRLLAVEALLKKWETLKRRLI